MSGTETTEKPIDKFEKTYGKTNDEEFSNAHEEVYKLLTKDKDGTLKALNQQIKDNNKDNPLLKDLVIVGLDKNDGDLRFKDEKSGNFFDVDKSGKKKAILGADENGNNGREFTTDEKGNIVSYNVKKGDTVWSIAETICNERNKGTDKKTTPQDIQAESKKLIAANPELKQNPDKIIEGKTTIKVSAQSSEEISKKRNPELTEEQSKVENLKQVKDNRAYVDQVLKELDPNNTGYVSKDALVKKADSLSMDDPRRDLLHKIAARQDEIQNSTWSGWLWDKYTSVNPFANWGDQLYYGDSMNRESIRTYLDQYEAELSQPKQATPKPNTPTPSPTQRPTPTPTPTPNDQPLPKVTKMPGD
ncbi:MAG: LysM peptidoglycan-binding domain-containing protein [Candidatus Melainabacteria bacterium]|nr:LysM peptidoglycan-binding domain-containing protein [Candidatus Melainabacteria bacterium]